MGTPVEPGEKGVDCPACTPGTWAVGQTPKYLMVMFTGIIKCPGAPGWVPNPPNGAWILTQKVGEPCWWFNSDSQFIITYRIFAGVTYLHIAPPWGGWSFYAEQNSPCWAYFASAITCPMGHHHADGSAFTDLFDFPGTAHQLLHDYGLAPVDYTKFDVFGCEGEPPYIQVRRFGNVRTPTNVKIKTDDTHKDQYEMFEE